MISIPAGVMQTRFSSVLTSFKIPNKGKTSLPPQPGALKALTRLKMQASLPRPRMIPGGDNLTGFFVALDRFGRHRLLVGIVGYLISSMPTSRM